MHTSYWLGENIINYIIFEQSMSSNKASTNTNGNTQTYSSSSSNGFDANAVYQVFTQSNIVIILWFLAVYFVVYILLTIFRGNASGKSNITRWVDIVALLCLLVYLGSTFFTKSDAEKQQVVSDIYRAIKSYMDSPISLISIGFFILTLYIMIYILGIPMDQGKPITISLIENGAWLLFVLVVISTFLQYVAGVSLSSLMDSVKKYLQERAALATSITGNVAVSGNTVTGNATTASSSASLDVNEVFNIGNNMYTFDDAQSVCQSFGARLATYDEVESAYTKGAEWCNYGWSDGQAAYFPTQKSTWQELQKSESTKHSCGRPGVNGGYIANPNVRFGVNCYGKKPKPKPADLAALSSGKNIPKTPEDVLLDRKVQFWKDNGDKLFTINSYNGKKWSMY